MKIIFAIAGLLAVVLPLFHSAPDSAREVRIYIRHMRLHLWDNSKKTRKRFLYLCDRQSQFNPLMKRVLCIFFFMLIALSSYSQAKEFFGLRLGQKYTRQQIIDSVGKNGIFVENPGTSATKDAVSGQYHVFAPANYNGEEYSVIDFMTLEDGTFAYISFIKAADGLQSPSYVDSSYNSICRKLFALYPELKDNKFEVEGKVVYSLPNSDRESVKITLVKDSEGNTFYYEVAYSDLDSLLEGVLDDYEKNLPDIQDTFFGMTVRKKYSSSAIKSYVGSKGIFLEENREGDINSIVFKDIYFAGIRWDFGQFLTSGKNELFYFEAYNSLPDGYTDDDERREAKRTYESLKARLDVKYGEGHEDMDEDGNLETYYFGRNDMVVSIRNYRSKSTSGLFRRFVGIKYINKTLLNSQSVASDNDL